MKRLANLSLLSLAALLILGGPVHAEKSPAEVKAEVDAINAAIKKNGGKWVAGETSLSKLSFDERKRRVGVSLEDITATPLDETVMWGAPPPPAALDWRDNGGNYVTAIRDQAQCGGCWAFAMTAGLESHVLYTDKTPGKELALSEQVMISCDKDGGDSGCDGGFMNANFLINNGLPLESAVPYTSGAGDSGACQTNWSQATPVYKIGKWSKVRKNLSAIKSALNQFGPLPTTFLVYEDFMHYKSGVYSYSGQGKELGGHAVLIVGYNDDGQYFIVKNSWGADWGENGFFKIAYSEMKTRVGFGRNTLVYPENETTGGEPKKKRRLWPWSWPFNNSSTLEQLKNDPFSHQ